MTFAPATRINAILVSMTVCWTGFGACLGFLLGRWSGAVAGAGVAGPSAAAGLFLYRRRAVASRRTAESRGHTEGTADVVLLGIALYEAAVFPLVPDGVNEEEQEARRTVAYRVAPYDGLPQAVRLSAAAALEAIDEGLDIERVRAAFKELTLRVYDCRVDR
ncbi:hypothetical protein ACIRPU_41890 [Streptomyces sp. NPDC102259]|uniref:hypothetical protein n=1 Tax=Streptomyces sp. NPDC102259 TaxID=3366148 RepID=UPI00382A5332